MKTDLLNFTLPELEKYFLSLGEKKYRAKQVFKWIYINRVSSFQEMTNLPVQLRKKLENHSSLVNLKIKKKNISSESDTIKYLFKLLDNEFIETVLIYERKRRTVCISTQVGCPLGCKFCATGEIGHKRNLTIGEIVGQVLSVIKDSKEDITNIVVMGMGEPFLNYDNVMKAVNILSDNNGLAVAPRRITISTAGIITAIKRFADEGNKTKLAISLNAVSDEIRNKLMTVSKKYPINELLDSARYYTKKANKKIIFEYVLINDINDSVEDAKKLSKLVGDISCKVNLIPYNITQKKYNKPSKEKIDIFFRTLSASNIQVNVRWSKGEDISAACGQLAFFSK